MNGKLSSVTAIIGLLIVPACVGDFGAEEGADDFQSAEHEQIGRRRFPGQQPAPATPVQSAPVVQGAPCVNCPPGTVVGPAQAGPVQVKPVEPQKIIKVVDEIVDVEVPLKINLNVDVLGIDADEPVLLELVSASTGKVLISEPVKARKTYPTKNVEPDTKFYFVSKDRKKRFLVSTPATYEKRRASENEELLGLLTGTVRLSSSSTSSSSASGEGFAASSSRSDGFGSRTTVVGNGTTQSGGTRETGTGFEQTFLTEGLSYEVNYNKSSHTVTATFHVYVLRAVAAVGEPTPNTYVEPAPAPAPAPVEQATPAQTAPVQQEERRAPVQQEERRAPVQQEERRAPVKQEERRVPAQTAPAQTAPAQTAPAQTEERRDDRTQQAAPAQTPPARTTQQSGPTQSTTTEQAGPTQAGTTQAPAPAQAAPAQAVRTAPVAPPPPIIIIQKRIVKRYTRTTPSRFEVGAATEIKLPERRAAAPEQQTREQLTPPPPATPEE